VIPDRAIDEDGLDPARAPAPLARESAAALDRCAGERLELRAGPGLPPRG